MDSGRLLLMGAAAMLVTASFAVSAVVLRHQAVDWHAALAFGGFVAFGELLRLALPGGREAAPIAMVGAMSYALLLTVPGESPGKPVVLPAVLVVAVCAVGMT